MTQEEKQLLLKDLCARLPYYTELYSSVADHNWAILTPVVIYNLMNATDTLIIKPYLRPMSSMTEDEREEYKHCQTNYEFAYFDNAHSIDWLNSNHFDYRWLIEKGLALEAPKDMYNTKTE